MTGFSECGFQESSISNFERIAANKDCANPYWLAPKLDYIEPLDIRDYGISKCIESAKRIFTPEILVQWPDFSQEHRIELVQLYGQAVADNFDLKDFKEIIIKDLGYGVNGENCGDGYIYLSRSLVCDPMASPLQVVDTITHEMRHQFQSECIEGKHNVPAATCAEWKIGQDEYTDLPPFAFDPWGYKYNPLELDARYAGETVVREFTKEYRA